MNHPLSDREKAKESELIAAQIAEFKKRGGKIKKCKIVKRTSSPKYGRSYSISEN